MQILKYLLLFLVMLSCKKRERTSKDLYYKEVSLPYNSEIYHISSKIEIMNEISGNKFSGLHKEYEWLRNKKNILELHGIFKKIGYKNLVSDSVYNSKIFTNPVDKDFDWYNLSSRKVIDSLLYYKTIIRKDNYYTKFWKRRVHEGNDKEVFVVISEIQKIYDGKDYQTNSESIKDEILYNLINLNYHFISDKSIKTEKKYINYLKEKGLYQSAYNITLLYPEIKINKDSLSKLLQKGGAKEVGSWAIYREDNGS